MRLALVAGTFLLVGSLFAPVSAAQAVAAEACVRMCDPRDATVNPAPSARSVPWLFFYAPEPERADLVLVPLSKRVSTTLGASGVPGFGCYTLRWTLGDIVDINAVNPAYEGMAWAPAKPVSLGSETLLLFLYVRIPQPVATIVPVHVEATIQEGLNGGGDVVATGFLDAELDGQRLWELRIPLGASRSTLPLDSGSYLGFLMEIRFCISARDTATVSLPVEFVTGPQTPARLLISAGRPIESLAVRTVRDEDALRVQYSVLATFGQYDVDIASATIDLVGRHARGPWLPELVEVKRIYDEASPRSPVVLEWRINGTEFFDNTEYTIRAKVGNLQGTAHTEIDTKYRTLVFTGDSRVPGVSLPMGLFAVGVLAALLGARRNRR